MENQRNTDSRRRGYKASDLLFGLVIVAICGYMIIRTAFKWRHIEHAEWSDRIIWFSVVALASAALVGVGVWLYKKSQRQL